MQQPCLNAATSGHGPVSRRAAGLMRPTCRPRLGQQLCRTHPAHHYRRGRLVAAAAAAAAELGAAPAEPALDQRQQQQQQQQQPEGGSSGRSQLFNWRRAWYPVAVVSQLDPRRPRADQLLGIPLVLWRDGQGGWRCFEDRCPHRLAPLSEGRLDPDSGHLMCSYHGWQFDGSGRCSSIPQIGEAAAHSTACSSKRTCAVNFPCREAQGLLWVWPDASSAAAAESTPPALSEQYGAEGWTLLGGEWFQRDLEYGFDTLMENLFDPSHIPFAHHGIMGTASRDKALPLSITTTADVTPQGGFQLFRDSAPFRTAAPTDTVNAFIPPALNVSSQTNTAKGTTLVLTFYGIPLAPGKSRVITAFFTNAKVPGFVKRLSGPAEAWFHLGQNQVLDSDAMLLHVQERLLHEGRDRDWRSAFFLPAGADTGVIKFRSWYHDCAGGCIPWPAGMAESAGLGPVKPRQVVMDRYHQHVAGCKACSAAVKLIQRLQVAALGLAAVAAAAAVAATTATAVVSSAAAATGAGCGTVATCAGGLQAAVTGALAGVPTWACAALGLVAVLLLAAHVALGQLKQRFFFIDYVHADR